MALLLAGCFPTYQVARIDPGWHLDAGATWLHDQPRDSLQQGADLLFSAGPVYGWDSRVEIGLPLVAYFEGAGGGAQDRFTWLMPYLKLGLLPESSRNHLAVSLQGSILGLGNIGLHASREMGDWEPQVSFGYIVSGGPAGDDPVVTRFQRDEQSLLTFAVGATGRGWQRPSIQLGVLRNRFRTHTVYGSDGRDDEHRTFWDLFIAVGYRFSGR